MRIFRDLRRFLAWMSGFIRPLGFAIEPHTELSRDTVEGCRDRAAAGLEDANNSTDPHERKQLRKASKRWLLRADMLERMTKSFRKRAALDEASKQYHRDRYS